MVTSLINRRLHNCFFILFKYSRVCHHPSSWQILKFSDGLFLESFLKNGVPCLAVYGTSVSYSLPCKAQESWRERCEKASRARGSGGLCFRYNKTVVAPCAKPVETQPKQNPSRQGGGNHEAPYLPEKLLVTDSWREWHTEFSLRVWPHGWSCSPVGSYTYPTNVWAALTGLGRFKKKMRIQIWLLREEWGIYMKLKKN